MRRAPTLGFILVARVLQGAGGGALQPLSQSILLESFPPEKRGVAMALFGFGVVCAPVLGPTLGGWLTDAYSWRYAFYINIPVGILAMFMIGRFVHDAGGSLALLDYWPQLTVLEPKVRRLVLCCWIEPARRL